MMNYKSYNDLGNDVYSNLHKLQGKGFDLVVGIPRSGMVPAYMIALLLNVCCVDLNSFLKNAKVMNGNTRKITKTITKAWDAEKILLVDDSLKTGASMQQAVDKITREVPRDVTRLAVYVEKIQQKNVDIHFEILPGPRIYQWNLFHHSLMGSSCVELEGVLCLNPSEEEMKSEVLYEMYISEASPLVLPTYQVQTILTSRTEKYRKETERWLVKNNIVYEALVMSNKSFENQAPFESEYLKFKADYYKSSAAQLFVDKEWKVARDIANLSGKPVLSLESSEMLLPGIVAVAKHGKQHLLATAMRKCRRQFFLAMPNAAVASMRAFYRKMFR